MISASMIVKNEEALLAECLESIKGIDEIVVCDTGSVDKTIEVAKKYTDKIFTDYKWNDNFAEARNHSMSKCSGDWILIIDADEIFKGDMDRLKEFVGASNGQRTFDFKAFVGKQYIWQPRLIKNHEGIYYQGAAHNYLNVMEYNKTEFELECRPSPAHAMDPNRTLRILLKTCQKDKNLVREKYYLGREYGYKKDYLSGIYWLNEYLKVANWGPEWAEGYLLLAKYYWHTKEFEKARQACLNAIKINANFKEAFELMASLSGPKNKKRWLEFASTATNEDVLFVRC